MQQSQSNRYGTQPWTAQLNFYYIILICIFCSLSQQIFASTTSIFTSFFWFFAIRRTSHIDSIVQSKILLGRLHFGNNYKNQVHLND